MSFVFLTLEVVFASRVDCLPDIERRRVEVAHEPIDVVGTVEVYRVRLHLERDITKKNYNAK